MNAFGQDMRGTPNIFLDDGHLPHILGALIIAGLVDVEKVADGDAEGFGGEAERGGMRGAKVTVDARDALAKRDGARDAAALSMDAAAQAQAEDAAIAAEPTTPAANA